MNLILLTSTDFTSTSTVSLRDARRVEHIQNVHRASAGDSLIVGVEDGLRGKGVVTRIEEGVVEMQVTLDRDPPPPSAIELILALPRPKVLNRVIASAVSLGVKSIYLLNAWRVEKSFWGSPRLSPENVRFQAILGLEQARDTRMPRIETRRLFRPFVENELPSILTGKQGLVAHPGLEPVPSPDGRPIVLAVGPEGGFIAAELESLRAVGMEMVAFGERPLRVETIIPFAVARLTG